MRNRKINKIFIMAFGLVTFSACAPITATKDITADKTSYANKILNSQTLKADVVKMLPKTEATSDLGKIIISEEVSEERYDGKKLSWNVTTTYTDFGNGLIQTVTESSHNDIPFYLAMAMTYRGFVDLKWQNTYLSSAMPNPIYEIKKITRFDAFPTTEKKDFVVNFTTGTAVQIANFLSSQQSCRSTRVLNASDIFSSFSGGAIEFECALSDNNLVTQRTKWVLLQKYGVCYQTEFSNSSMKKTFRVISVSN